MSVLSADDQQQLDRVLAVLREVLKSNCISAYLFGSAVLGGLHPQSDIDVLAVSKRPAAHDEKQRLVRELLAISGRRTSRGRWRHVELTIVVAGEIKPWRYPPRFDFQYGDWLRNEFERGDIEPWPTTVNPDLAVLITLVRLSNTTLFGPPPAEMFDPVPRADLIRAMVTGLDTLLDELESDTRNVVLTLARIWCTVATGDIRPKDAAAEWALHRLPEAHRPVFAHARAVYRGEEVERWDALDDHIRPCVDYVVGAIRAEVAD